MAVFQDADGKLRTLIDGGIPSHFVGFPIVVVQLLNRVWFCDSMEPTRLLCPWDFQAKILDWAALSLCRVLPPQGPDLLPALASLLSESQGRPLRCQVESWPLSRQAMEGLTATQIRSLRESQNQGSISPSVEPVVLCAFQLSGLILLFLSQQSHSKESASDFQCC